MKNEEEFRDVPGFEGRYQVSNFGRIKSIHGKGKGVGNGPLFTYGFIDSVGYRQVTFRISNKRHCLRVHRLVANAFLAEGRSDQNFVNHIDGDKLNNHVSNLEWATHTENLRHAINTGLLDTKGEKSVNSKLTEEQVLQIRQLYHTKTQSQLAEQFGIGRRHIGDIVNGVCWGHLPVETYGNRNGNLLRK